MITQASSKHKVNDKVSVIYEDSKEYGMEGFVTKVGFSECEVLLQDNSTTWFSDHKLEKIRDKNDK